LAATGIAVGKIIGASDAADAAAFHRNALQSYGFGHSVIVLEFIMRLSRRGLSAGGLFSSDFVLANLRGNQ
jgi:hypothetical protein